MFRALRSRRTAARPGPGACVIGPWGQLPSPAAEADPLIGAPWVPEPFAQAAYRGDTAKNIILFVGDGMGISSVSAARIYAGQKAGALGGYQLSLSASQGRRLSKTYNNQQTADSAAP